MINDKSLDSAATYVRCGGLSSYHFITSLLLNLVMKEIVKSVNTRWSYGKKYSVLVLDSQCTSSVKSPLSSSMTPSLFHSWLKTYLYHKPFPPKILSPPWGLTPWLPLLLNIIEPQSQATHCSHYAKMFKLSPSQYYSTPLNLRQMTGTDNDKHDVAL